MQKLVTIQKLMPQPRRIQTTAKLRLTFNISQIDELVPAFQSGDFAVMYGSQNITSLMAQLCIRAPLSTEQGGLESKVIFIDAANSSTLPSIRQAAERQYTEPQKTLNQIQTFRAYTAYRLHSLIIEELEQIIKTSDAKLVVISDVMCPFLTENVDDQEARAAYNQIMNYLSNFAKKHNIIIITTNLPHENNTRTRILQEITSAKTDINLRHTKTQYTSDIELEKHPTYMLGVMDFTPETKTLTDF
jgi:hypothetical protein